MRTVTMKLDLMDLYRRGSEWTGDRSPSQGPRGVDALLGMDGPRSAQPRLDTQRYFASAGRGESATPPGPNPPDTVSDTPASDFAQARSAVISVFSEEGVIDKTMPALGVAFTDALIHGWDVAQATGQDATMPDGLAQAAYTTIHGRFTDEQRKGLFAPEVPVADDATPQQRLLAYTGRTRTNCLLRPRTRRTSAHVASAAADRGRGAPYRHQGNPGTGPAGEPGAGGSPSR